jgi:hypothetical protein
MKMTARTLERVLLVTSKHHGFVRCRLDQAHLRAARKTPHVVIHSISTASGFLSAGENDIHIAMSPFLSFMLQ